MDVQSSSIVILSGEAKFNVGLFIALIALIIFSAFFSMSETAYSSISETKLKVAIDNKAKGSKMAFNLYNKFDRTLTTLLIGNNLVNVATSTLAVTFFTLLAVSEEWISLISTAVVTIVLLIFGEIVPKMVAKRYPDSICCKVSYIIYFFNIIFWPLATLFVLLQKVLDKNKEEGSTATDKDELDVIIDEMEDNGSIENDEADVLHNALDMSERAVEDIMVPRIKMSAIDYNLTLEEVKDFVVNNQYSRIPVYKGDKDHIVGVLYTRDFYPAIVKNPRCSWKKLLRPVRFVSGAMKADDLIHEMQKSKTHMAIVSGEYGDVLGLVTMEDALEELVGEIYDEHDENTSELTFVENEDGSYLVDAEMFVDDLFEKINVGDAPEDVPAKISGWLFEQCESLPDVGFTLNYIAKYTAEDEEGTFQDYKKLVVFTISEVKNRAITKVLVKVSDATDEDIEKYDQDDED